MKTGCGKKVNIYHNEWFICGKKYSDGIRFCDECIKEQKAREHIDSMLPNEPELKEAPNKKYCWIEEYKNCSCTFIADKIADLPKYCPKHGSDKKHKIKIPNIKDIEKGYISG